MTTTDHRQPMGRQMRRLAARRRPVAATWAATWTAAHTATGTVHACKHGRPREHRTG